MTKAMERIIFAISLRTISGFVLGCVSLYGCLVSCAAGDAYGIIALAGLCISILIGAAAFLLIIRGLLRREPLARKFYHLYSSK